MAHSSPKSLFKDGAPVTEALSVSNLSLSSVINSLEGKTWTPLLRGARQTRFYHHLTFVFAPPPQWSINPPKPLVPFLSPALLFCTSSHGVSG